MFARSAGSGFSFFRRHYTPHYAAVSTPKVSSFHYPSFISAIKKQDLKTVDNYLKNVGHFLLHKDASQQTPLHIALEFGSYEIVAAIMQRLQLFSAKEFNEILTAADVDGWTPLHMAARWSDFKTFSMLVTALGSNAHLAAQKITHSGDPFLPLELACLRRKTSDRKAIKKLLKDITIERTQKNLQSPILFSKIIKKIPTVDNLDKDLLNNLHYGCIAATHVRKFISKSITHTNSNSLDKVSYRALWSESKQMRSECKTLNDQISALTNTDEYLEKKLDNIEKTVKAYAEGNCYEYSCLVLNTLIKMGIPANAEIFEIRNGDHVFVVIGRDLKSPEKDFTKWGNQAVIVDAWAHKVYPATELPNKLRDFIGYKDKYSILRASLTLPFDLNYHKVKRKLGFTDQFFKMPRAKDLTDFTQDETNEIAKDEQLIQGLTIKKTQP